MVAPRFFRFHSPNFTEGLIVIKTNVKAPRREENLMIKNSLLKTQNLKLPIIVGPTGVGKSEVAYHLALRLKAEILSADAFQVYRDTEIGTAQPPKEWQTKIKHHLIVTRQ